MWPLYEKEERSVVFWSCCHRRIWQGEMRRGAVEVPATQKLTQRDPPCPLLGWRVESMQFREIVLNLGRKKGRRVVIPRPEDKGGRWGVGWGGILKKT